ncbi:MAG: hypothetical protein PHX84_01380 [Candidatus Shapirobacteria bacterium]|jgi:hypothetical protein|nr:hypothetical protein [Candidatus Shapirobacteria bacterium]
MLVTVINPETNKQVSFEEVNQAVPIPIKRDAMRPGAIKISSDYDEHMEIFTTAIKEKGWYLRQVTI